MRLSKINVTNFRNIDDITIVCHNDANYIVGENNIGKSNLFDLMYIIGNSSNFKIEDFKDQSEPIQVTLTLKLNEYELGKYSTNLKSSSNVVNIKMVQQPKEVSISIMNKETGEILTFEDISNINFIIFDMITTSSTLLRFNKTSISLLKFVVDKFISGNEINIQYKNKDSLLYFFYNYVQKYTKLIDSAKNASEVVLTLKNLLKENSLPIEDEIEIEITTIAALNIMSSILELHKNRSDNLDFYTFISESGKRIMPLILAIDEPEVHLHPYMQRAILNFYKRILNNDDTDFLQLLKFCFDIDGIDGQLFIVTHSTDALVDDHRNIIRYYKNAKGNVCTVSGMQMNIKLDVEKHLIMHFPEIKEAFYARCTIIVEGETEYGCIKAFANTLNTPLDDYGICLVNARGEGTIPKLEKLFRHFMIPSVLIYDSDVRKERKPKSNEFYTSGVCFEMDIVSTLIDKNRIDLLKKIVMEYDSKADKRLMDYNFVKKPLRKINYDLENYQAKKLVDLTSKNILEYTALHFAWYFKKKGIILGRLIGNTLEPDCIPQTYKAAIEKAIEVSR